MKEKSGKVIKHGFCSWPTYTTFIVDVENLSSNADSQTQAICLNLDICSSPSQVKRGVNEPPGYLCGPTLAFICFHFAGTFQE